jgi:hypothetical protein
LSSRSIIQVLKDTNDYIDLFQTLGQVTDDLLNNDDEAAVFVCEILQGDIPGVLEELGTEAVDAVLGEFQSMTSFIVSLPSIAPEILNDIVQGGEEAVSIVDELVTNPGGALTVIENGIETIFSEITAEVGGLVSEATSIFGDITYFFGCDIGGNCPSSTGNGMLSSCSTVMEQYSATVTVSRDQIPTTGTPVLGTGTGSHQASRTATTPILSGSKIPLTGTPGPGTGTVSYQASGIATTSIPGGSNSGSGLQSSGTRLTCMISAVVALSVGFILLVL